METEKRIRIPFDSFVLQAVVAELQPFVGGLLQEIRQPNDTDIVLSFYNRGVAGMFLISCHADFARAHFITKRVPNQIQPPMLCATLRARVDGSKLVEARQIEGDRIFQLCFEGSLGTFFLIVELMGKHSNIVFCDSDFRVLSAAKWVGRSKSRRPIQPNMAYELPPVMQGEGKTTSPFYRTLQSTDPNFNPSLINPIISPGNGAYPVSVSVLGLPEFARNSISIALEQHYALAIPSAIAESIRSLLLTQIHRAVLAKEVALDELEQARDAGGKAPQWQRFGELILAYGPSQPVGEAFMKAWDYDGTEVEIRLKPDMDFKANASEYFEKAKKAKGRMSMVADQIQRLSQQRSAMLGFIERVNLATRLEGLQALKEEASRLRWLNVQAIPTARKEDRPYEGHRVRELHGPSGYVILYGENAEANDYLTLRVARSNDYWLHVRGDTSAHVVIQTRNQPEKVQMDVLMFAAKVAVQNSRVKHSSYVSVDYTLRKYVRRQRGAAKGSVVYTHEKTLNIES